MHHFRKSALSLLLPTLALILSACGGQGTTPPPGGGTTAPAVAITSPGVSVSAEYELTGTAWASRTIDSASYSLNGSESDLSIAAGEFATVISLQPGLNEITVTATDTAGNEGSASRSVQFGVGELVLSTEIAMRGDSIDLGGAFGPGGSVTIGGVPAAASSWSASAISAEIPLNAPSGWVEVTVTSNTGVQTASLFVGTAFAPGRLDELVALGLPPGTAVQLAAGNYTVDTKPLFVNNISLYGQGPDQTTIDTGTDTDALRFVVSASHDFALRDLSLVTDGTFIVPGGLGITSASGPFDPFSFASTLDLAKALAERFGGQLATQTDRPSVTLQNLAISHNLGASVIGFGVTDLFGDSIFHGDVTMHNVKVDAASVAYVATSGGIVMTDSQVTAGGAALMSIGGDVQVERSRFDLSGADMTGGLLAQNRLLADAVTFISRGSNPSFGSMSAESGNLSTTYASSVTNSGFHSFEPDPSATGPDAMGSLTIMLGGSPTFFTNNTITAHRDTTITLSNGNILFENNTFSNGTSGIPQANLHINQRDMHIPHHTFRNNTFDWMVNGGVHLSGYLGSLALSGNTLTGAGAGTAVTVEQKTDRSGPPWSVNLQDNTFSDFAQAFYLSQPIPALRSLNMTIAGNIFDFEFTAAPQVAELTDVSFADIDANGNQWGSLTTAGAARAFVTEAGTTPAGTFVISRVLTP